MNHAVFTFNDTNIGSYRMVMNVANVGDEIYSSALFFAGASISGGEPIEPAEVEAVIPEPRAVTLLSVGSFALLSVDYCDTSGARMAAWNCLSTDVAAAQLPVLSGPSFTSSAKNST